MSYKGWPENKNLSPQHIRMFRDDMAVPDGIVIKTRCIVIPEASQQQVLNQLHTIQMGIKKALGMQICILVRYEHKY